MTSINHYIKKLSEYKHIINESNKLPLYYQVELIIENLIESENISGGDFFLSEIEVADQLGVSRPTVNRAFRNLIEKGVLARNRGKRSVVGRVKSIPLIFMSELVSFGEMLRAQKLNYRTVLLERKKEISNSRIRRALNIGQGEELVYLKRLRYVEEEPIIIVDSYLPYKKYSKLLEIPEEDFGTDLYKIIKNLYGVFVSNSKREVTATSMTLYDANLLKEEIWRPCLRLCAVNYDEKNEPVEFFDSRLKGEKCILETSLKKEKQ